MGRASNHSIGNLNTGIIGLTRSKTVYRHFEKATFVECVLKYWDPMAMMVFKVCVK